MTDKNPNDDKEGLKTFDMYHFFSRKDVIAVIVLVLIILVFVLWKTLFPAATV
ncbi:MAG: hypothetical protein ACPGRX_00255 [Bdellovibrionales bacterium]